MSAILFLHFRKSPLSFCKLCNIFIWNFKMFIKLFIFFQKKNKVFLIIHQFITMMGKSSQFYPWTLRLCHRIHIKCMWAPLLSFQVFPCVGISVNGLKENILARWCESYTFPSTSIPFLSNTPLHFRCLYICSSLFSCRTLHCFCFTTIWNIPCISLSTLPLPNAVLLECACPKSIYVYKNKNSI